MMLGAIGGFFPARIGREERDPRGAAGDLTSWKRNSKALRIDRAEKAGREPRSGPRAGSSPACCYFVLLGAARFAYDKAERRARKWKWCASAGGQLRRPRGGAVILNATGYIVAAHKIEVAAKVVGKVAWIGVDKGDQGQEGQVIVRLEDDEYRAQLAAGEGQLANLEAKLAELQTRIASGGDRRGGGQSEHGQSRPGERARHSGSHQESWLRPKVVSQAGAGRRAGRVTTAQWRAWLRCRRRWIWSKLGPRQEQIDAVRGQVEQAQGALAYAETQLDNTVIRAPVTGTILERAVEKGEFVTTRFVGDKGAKGYVVSLADLNDLQVELDISQNDFAKLRPAPERHRHHRRVSRPQIRRLHRRDFAGSQPPEGHRAGQGEGRESGRLSAAGDERERGVCIGREAGGRGSAGAVRSLWCRLRRCAIARYSWCWTARRCGAPVKTGCDQQQGSAH